MATYHCMLAHKFDPARIQRWPVVVEPKLDGVRVLADVDAMKGTVVFRSRANKPFYAFEHLAPSLLAATERLGRLIPIVTFDGEMISGSFLKTVSQARKKSEPALDAVYHVFDFFPPANQVLSYANRRFVLAGCGLTLTPSYIAHDVAEIHELYRQFRENGLEGAIVKDPAALYEFKRSYAWMKMKAEESADCEVIDFLPGEGKHTGRLGALVVEYEGTDVQVGTGLTDEERETIWQDKSAYKGRIAEVAYHEVTPVGRLRHPRFVRFRDITTHGVKE